MTLDQIKAHARKYRCYVVTKGAEFILYREAAPRGVRIGKSGSVEGLSKLVKRACGST